MTSLCSCRATARHIDAKDVIEIAEPLLFDLQADVGEQNDVAKDHPDVKWDEEHIDAMTSHLVRDPERFDVVALVANRSVDALKAQVNAFQPGVAVLCDEFTPLPEDDQ